ncbi:bifunctional tRNA (5-methylaminomethyl-2-thiouridine)(34)-methyltransferase MnmD/FAD-dependent 5-carboxymethylaminomethyl-2-thiouridine(34) oxidoreductase MnmC [Teredinibacter franksiae]|uniref:bifunctional tRNA (5-methylaminomethyl-2-thiouridine)(34)-methyltransferase MnmD/FAD-dependent 5-carboxymethylaminomethyl-2-thiouridine(34) oxidoreductase MnmC n=1 Tax=Teredinibacter franksiae TaxID=2761453 RepID=UPI0016266565|nr:bifunctional tRNA (5-methylaminomethyl-2-thiouridine)(34)-methyltransferase MnmD/FAD-dependent 5-carboxymethylaminomethyl-2-thiouridine(34) oxidoreductase MnmC [Teredinibacter franksiae]
MNKARPAKNPTTCPADITWNENSQPISTQFDDVYFSTTDGLKETEFVFLQHNNLPQRWQTPTSNNHFTVAETGFGTGLNFLVTWYNWQKQTPQNTADGPARLHFISVEKYPLLRADLARALALWPEFAALSEQLLSQYPPQPIEGTFRLTFDDGKVLLTLIFSDAENGLTQIAPCSTLARHAGAEYTLGNGPLVVDAWFLDGFSPAKNPEMWTPTLFQSMAKLSGKNTTFSTFTSARVVREGLKEAGFHCIKVSGFGLKREMLYGHFQPVNHTDQPATTDNSQRRDAAHHYWHLCAAASHEQSSTATIKNKNAASAIVVGGGLAGCQAAHALAQRGIRVTLLEKNSCLADEASGNRQGALYTRLSPQDDPLSRFNLSAQIFANNFYSSKKAHGSLFDLCGDQCGVIHLCTQDRQKTYYQQLANRFQVDEHFCQWLECDAVSELSGLKIKLPGLFLPQAGWISPVKLCEQLCAHPLIDVLTNTEVKELNISGKGWAAIDTRANTVCEANYAIIANAHAAQNFEQTAHLQLKTIRGQVSHILEDWQPLSQLKTVLCGEGYISPSQNGIHCAGATFNLRDASVEISQQDHDTNLHNLKQMIELPNSPPPRNIEGRVGFRTTTPDYFPIVGPAPMAAPMEQNFASLRHRANAVLSAPGEFYPGLYTLLGLGSRGLAYSPIAADLLASLVCSEPLPVDQKQYRQLHPARFLIRNLMRNKPSTL